MWKSRIARTAAVVLVVVVLLLTMAWLFQRKLIYFPDTATPSPPPAATQVSLKTKDGLRLGGWQFDPTGKDRRSAVLVASGNGGNRSSRISLAQNLSDEGFTVLIFDYRGYGGNEGSPHESGLYLDAEAAYDHLTATAGFSRDRILYLGESLGGGVVTHLALKHPPAGMMLRSPFTSLPDVGQRQYPFLPVRALLTEEYPVKKNVSMITVPTVVVYGTADSIVPAQQSKQVARTAEASGAPVATVAVAGADHNDPQLVQGPLVIAAMTDLADKLNLTPK